MAREAAPGVSLSFLLPGVLSSHPGDMQVTFEG